MKIELSAQAEQFIQQQVDSGRYASPEEAVEAAIRLWRDRTEELRREIHVGIDELDRGERSPLDMEEIKREGRQRLASSRTEPD